MPNPSAITVIVTLPETIRVNWPTISQILAHHGYPACLPHAVLPVNRTGLTGLVTRWSSRHLIDPDRRRGTIARVAGGPIRRLDLHTHAGSARMQAEARWRTWHRQIAAITPAAKPWEHFLEEHHRRPDDVTLEVARRRFEAQPRVLAMLAHNADPATEHHLDPYDLAEYQAGETVYVVLHWQHALTGDALIDPHDRFLTPASPSIADRLRYLAGASRVVHHLSGRDHLVAVRASHAP